MSEEENKMSNFKGAVGWEIIAGLNGYSTLSNLLDVATTKAVVLQKQLSTAPELTEQLYHSATKAAEEIASKDLYLGWAGAVATGLSFGMCVYRACKKEKE